MPNQDTVELEMIRFPSCDVDLRTEQVTREGETQPLTSREAELLRFLHAHPQKVLSREDLLEHVWGYSRSVVSRAADATIHRLRQKVEIDATKPQHIITVHGVGYRYEPPFRSNQPGLQREPTEQGWSPERIPQGNKEAREYWQKAHLLAKQHGQGFVGVEHLLLALDTIQGGGVHTSKARRLRLAGRAVSRLANLTVAAGDRSPDWRGTPRLRALHRRLNADHSVENIWMGLMLDPNRGVQALDQEGDGPGQSTPARWGRAPAVKLEVVGGPEDGRCISMATGEKLGRWWPGRSLNHGLYQDCFLEDPVLSRSGAMIWNSDGTITLTRAGWILRWNSEALTPGTTRANDGLILPTVPIEPGESVELLCGDLLFLSLGTCLRAC